MAIKQIVRGMITYIPPLDNFLNKGTRGTNSSRYCYSVWLRHLVSAQKNGIKVLPAVLAELGPGDSLGIGLAAMLSGIDKYYALDVVEFADIEVNLAIFDELVELFNRREPVPDKNEFPRVNPPLESWEFPSHILTEDILQRSLDPKRVQAIREILAGVDNKNANLEIRYFAPWFRDDVVKHGSVDMVLSQAVLEHVDDLPHTYSALNKWLKPNGFMSHQIDFGSHGLAKDWNGHRAYSDFIWKLIRGKREFLLNRKPYSVHNNLLKEYGFKTIFEIKRKDTSGISRQQHSTRFSNLSEDDITTSGAFIIATKQ